ncbi:MAG: hypothetical protein Q9220_007479 [cf. Caloplaca sp. 1 TL-2023]
MSSPLKHRRSSTFSDSVEDAKTSIKSSTDDLLLPRVKGSNPLHQLEPSHWHSAPLALALLPAFGGLFFQNGSAIVTDITLLSLAAVFLNWSVRLPWYVHRLFVQTFWSRQITHKFREWYLSSQSVPIPDTPPPRRDWSEDTIIEEEEEEEQNDNTAGKGDEPDRYGPEKGPRDISDTQKEHSAASELRMHELLALFACFLSPLLGAWLLHAIRAQLSRPSEGLVSNYNLTIFLLAAEVRPLSHLIKMVQARTLHLQRKIGTYPHEELNTDTATTTQLSKRLDELEAFAAQSLPNGKASNPDGELKDQIKADVRNSMQPDLDALNRAVRRYEKRIVALTMQTESRLQELESRMSDAITLAAAAERSSTQQRGRRGSSALIILDWASAAILLPARTAWAVISFPAKLAGVLMGTVEAYVGNKVKREMKTAGRTSSGHSRKSNTGSRGSKKPF